MTQEQFELVQRIDEKCGGRVLAECNAHQNIDVCDDAIAWRMMVEMVALDFAPQIESFPDGYRATSDCLACTTSEYGITTTRRTAGPTPFAAVLALAEQVLLC